MTVSVKKGITDLYGNPLDEVYSFTFSTIEDPTVMAPTASSLTNILSRNTMTFTFSEKMDTSSGSIVLSDSTLSVAGKSWNGAATQLTVTFNKYLPFGSSGENITLSGFKASVDAAAIASTSLSYSVLAAWIDKSPGVTVTASSSCDKRNYQLMAVDRLYVGYVSGGSFSVKAYDSAAGTWSSFGSAVSGVNASCGISCAIVPNITIPSNPSIYVSYVDSSSNLKIAVVDSSGATDLGLSVSGVTGSSLRANTSTDELYLSYSYGTNLELYTGNLPSVPSFSGTLPGGASYPSCLFMTASSPQLVYADGATVYYGNYSGSWSFTSASPMVTDSTLTTVSSISQISADWYNSFSNCAILTAYMTSTSKYEICSYNYSSGTIGGRKDIVPIQSAALNFDASYTDRILAAVRKSGSSTVTVYSAAFTTGVVSGWGTLSDFGAQDSSAAAIDANSSDQSVQILNIPAQNLTFVAYPDTSSNLKIVAHQY